MIRVRVDDFPNTKDKEKDRHSLDAFRTFHRCLSECIGGKRYLLGVIPKRCSVDDILFLRNETDCVVGMHGIYHNEEKLDIYQNEFPPYLSQREIAREIMDASAKLEDAVERPIYTYMPPRNRIDGKTLSVLGECLFTDFTVGPETGALPEHDLNQITYTPWAYGRTDEMLMQDVPVRLEAASAQGEDLVLTLHWTWETNIGLSHMKEFFSRIPTKHFKDFDD